MAPLHTEAVTEGNNGVPNKWESNCSTSVEQESVAHHAHVAALQSPAPQW